MLINLKKKIKKIKKLIDPNFVKNIFSKRIKNYYPEAKKIEKVEVEILRNFLGKFKNLTLRYKLFLDSKKRKIILGKANKLHDNPKRWFKSAKILEKNNFKEIPKVLDYLPSFNLVLYEEEKGESLQDLLIKKRTKEILESLPQIASFLKKLHSLKIKKILPIKNKKEENKEHRHWLFLIKKCSPRFLKRFKKIYYNFKRIKEKNKKIFLKEKEYSIVHGDFHFGNIIFSNKKIKIIDFGDVHFYDPLDDIARFLVQAESMLDYYRPKNFLKIKKKIENLFLGKYFQKELKKEEEIKIRIFKIRNLLQMAAILSFVIWPKKDKFLAVKKSLDLAEKEMNYFRN